MYFSIRATESTLSPVGGGRICNKRKRLRGGGQKMSRNKNAQVCDATKFNQGTVAGYQKILSLILTQRCE